MIKVPMSGHLPYYLLCFVGEVDVFNMELSLIRKASEEGKDEWSNWQPERERERERERDLKGFCVRNV